MAMSVCDVYQRNLGMWNASNPGDNLCVLKVESELNEWGKFYHRPITWNCGLR